VFDDHRPEHRHRRQPTSRDERRRQFGPPIRGDVDAGCFTVELVDGSLERRPDWLFRRGVERAKQPAVRCEGRERKALIDLNDCAATHLDARAARVGGRQDVAEPLQSGRLELLGVQRQRRHAIILVPGQDRTARARKRREAARESLSPRILAVLGELRRNRCIRRRPYDDGAPGAFRASPRAEAPSTWRA
jgi:hypothetical protein